MVRDGFLHKYYLNNGGKRLQKLFHYFDIYERHFERFRGRSPIVVEIGVFGGGSLAMWKSYFGLGSRIIGIDIDPSCKDHEAEGIEVFIGSQADPVTIEAVLEKYGAVDIVIDDGSHFMEHMIATFELLYGRISPDGVYLVEDTHTCYYPGSAGYGGGLGHPASFMEMVKGKIDEINAFHSAGAIPVSEFTRSTDSICCYDSVVVFERRQQGARQGPATVGL